MGVPEIGSGSIAELESVKGKLGLPVERDFHFAPRHTISVYARAARTEGTITECHAVLDKTAADARAERGVLARGSSWRRTVMPRLRQSGLSRLEISAGWLSYRLSWS